MSIFPFISPVAAAQTAEASGELPIYSEYACHLETKRLLTRDGSTYLVYGNEALRIWIYMALATERYQYIAYSPQYGSEIHSLIGAHMPDDVTKSEIKRYIIEALMVNPYIREVGDFTFATATGGLQVTFAARTVYGTEHIETTIERGG